MFIYKGKVFFIEFKRADEEPTKLQKEIHARLRHHEIAVYVVDSWSRGVDLVSHITQED
jgi:hypothetical protein